MLSEFFPTKRIRRRNDLILEDLIEAKLVDAVADDARNFSHRVENSLAS